MRAVTVGRAPDDVTLACVGLLAAWAVNDVEELLTMREDSAALLARAPRWIPVPDGLRAHGLTQRHVNASIAAMGALIAAASADGVRSRGQSVLFQSTLLGFGLHGFGHLVQAAVGRRWTTGARTSPTVVIPYWLWASRVLRRQGVDPTAHVSWPLAASTPLVMAAVHAGTAAFAAIALTTAKKAAAR
ncbi:hypothetical protein AXF14_06620 [Actinomyces radicidentis]|uniref:HXXEE domain-containing protein n=1 Tax=Actinomyces radicidentis TaxID=111015 RepID=A0A0X8JEY0_ACTRD|nr:HXXEE domain-containing protein [Actinomyces radicidentis]AMD87317.1 hypothetical protein AXF14_06620 [Actinomyces radicidentis]